MNFSQLPMSGSRNECRLWEAGCSTRSNGVGPQENELVLTGWISWALIIFFFFNFHCEWGWLDNLFFICPRLNDQNFNISGFFCLRAC